MSDSAFPPVVKDELQFATVEPANVPASATTGAASAGQACVACRQPLVLTYYALKDKVLCPSCYTRVMAPPRGSKLGRLLKASFLGFCGGLVGAVIWFAVRRIAHLEIGLVAILVGYLVGKGVRKGSAGRGGRAYQVLAVLITYVCVAANYLPDVIEALAARAPPVETMGIIIRQAIVAIAVSLSAPFLAGTQNLLGLLIIGFGLWQAWKLNTRRPLPITGPYQLRPQASPLPTSQVANINPPESDSQQSSIL